MPPLNKYMRFHRHGAHPSSPRSRLCRGNPQVVLPPFMGDLSSQKASFTSVPPASGLFNKSQYSDVTIKVESTGSSDSYHAHRCILSVASDVFATMLSSDWVQGGSNKVELNLVEDQDCRSIFSSFLSYIYSGSIVIDESNVIPLFVLADKYNVVLLVEECIKIIKTGLKVFKVFSSTSEGNGLNRSSELINAKWGSDCTSSMEESESSDLEEYDDTLADRNSSLPHRAALGYFTSRPHTSTQQSSSSEYMHGDRVSRPVKQVASETFTVSATLRLLNYKRIHEMALRNLEARVGNQISQGNYSTLWKDLSQEVVVEMLSDSSFYHDEYQLFVATKAWLEAYPERMKNQKDVEVVLGCLRYPLMTTAELYELEKDHLVKNAVPDLLSAATRHRLFKDYVTDDDIVREKWTGIQFQHRTMV